MFFPSTGLGVLSLRLFAAGVWAVAVLSLAGGVAAEGRSGSDADAEGRRTLAFWSFAGESLDVAHGQGELEHEFSSVTFFNGTDVNGHEDDGDEPGRSLALTGGPGADDDASGGNNGRSLYFLISTTGHDRLKISLAARRSATGFTRNRLAYSLDGGRNFSEIDQPFEPASAFSRHAFDLSAIEEVNDRQRLVIRITFHGATHPRGNNRLDNVHFKARPMR